MGNRHERVIIDLDDRFTRPMAGATAQTSMFRREVDSSGKSVVAFDRTVKDTSPTIDKLSGRLNLLAHTAAALGPGFAPIATAAVPALAGLVTELGFAAAGAGTAVLAFNGVGDALKALNEYQLDPTDANLQKLHDKMRGLGPAAREFVHFLDEIGPRLSEIRRAAQGGLLPGVQEGLDDLLTRAPQLRRIVYEIAQTAGDLVADAGGSLASDKWDAFFAFIEREARPALENLGRTVGHVATGLADLWMAMDPLSDDFSGGLLHAAEGFERWAAGLSATAGYQEFLDYVATTGPQVAETIGSLANMLLQVAEAAAPLGGPVLHILEAVADIVAKLADSDLGTPLLGAVSAMSALSLASRGWKAATDSQVVANTKASFSTKELQLATEALRVAEEKRTIAAQRAAVAQNALIPTADKRALVTAYASAQEQVVAATARVTAAEEKRRAGIRSTVKSAGRYTALVGGMALATSGLGDKMHLSNTASMALMGTMAGPWGAAIGGGIGLVMDLAAANDDLEQSINAARNALDNQSLSFDQQKAAVDEARAKLEEYKASQPTVGDVLGGGSFTDKLGGYWHKLSDLVTNSGEEGEKAVQGMEDELAQMPGYVSRGEAAFRRQADAIQANVNAMRSLREERLRAANAQLNFLSSINDARDAVKNNGKVLGDNGRILNKHNQEAIDAKRTLLGVAGAWNELSDKQKNAKGAHKAAIDTFVDLAVKLGMGEEQARDLAKALMEIPPKNKTAILVDAGQAFRVIDGVRMALRNLDGTVSDTYIRTIRQDVVLGRLGPTDSGEGAANRPPKGSADGSTVPKTGLPYADRHLYLLADGEEVISNRYGQADRHRDLLKEINANRYADGGTVGYQGAGGSHQYAGSTVHVAMPDTVVLRLEDGRTLRGYFEDVADNRINAHDHQPTGRRHRR